jgi:predicted phage tail protein
VDFARGDTASNRPAGGAAAIMLGLLTLTIQVWMRSTHTWDGVNYAGAFNAWMTVTGLSCLFLGAGLLLRPDRLFARRVWS